MNAVHRIRAVFFLMALMVSSLFSANVITWVPSYFISQSKTILGSSWSSGGSSLGMKDGITHLALQFWGPTNTSGAIGYVSNGGAKGTDADVTWFKNWGATNNAKVLLCVYNGASGWDWPTVNTIISNTTSRTALVNNLYNEMVRLGLDGIEVDLEGPQVTDVTQGNNFVAFMTELSTKVHNAGKLVTVATFASQWHTPGTQHWSKLFPLVDVLTSMGYEETGINAAGSLSYSGQKSLAGTSYDKLCLGMPTYSTGDGWAGSTTLQQVTWAPDNKVGVGIWDCSLGDGNGSANPYWRTYNIMYELQRIKGTAAVTTYSVTATANAGGTITPSGTTTVNSGASHTFTVAPNTGYKIDSVKVGTTKVTLTNNQYTISNITSNQTVTAWFSSLPTYTVTATVTTGGSISPSGTTTVSQGANHTFTVTPNTGYRVDSVKVNTTKVTLTNNQYTISNIQANQTVTAWYSSVPTYTVTATANTGGTISPAGTTTVSEGANHTFTVTPNSGYRVDSVKVGTSLVTLTNNQYTISNITANKTVTAWFGLKPTYTITVDGTTGGTVSPQGTNTVDSAANLAVTITAASGYMIDSVVVNGTSVGKVTSYTFSSVKANGSLIAYFGKTVCSDPAYDATLAYPTAGTRVSYNNHTWKSLWYINPGEVPGVNSGWSDLGACASSVTTYSVAATVNGNGTITPSGVTTVNSGANHTFTVAANSGNKIDSVKVNGTKVTLTAGQYTINNITSNQTVTAWFSAITYTVTASVNGNGTVTPSGVTTVNSGSNHTFTVTANSGNKIDSVKVGTTKVTLTNGQYTISNITANQTVTAWFSTVPTYSVTSSMNGNGTVTPATATVTQGDSLVITVTANGGNRIDSVKVNNVKVTLTSGKYTIKNIQANQSVVAWLSQIPSFTVTASVNGNGTISPSGVTTVLQGGSHTFSVAATAGNTLDSVKVNSTKVTLTNGQYTISNIQANQTVTAWFTPITYTITATAGTNGTISPAGAISVGYGASKSFAITPSTGYEIDSVKVNGAYVGAVATYNFTNVTANATISATFKVKTWTLTSDAMGSGAISPLGSTTVTTGQSQTYTITPQAFCSIDSVLVNGTNVGAVSTYTFSNVMANGTIVAFFGRGTCDADAWVSGTSYQLNAIVSYNGHEWQSTRKNNGNTPGSSNWKDLGTCATKTWTITASAGANGSITPAGTVTVTDGASQGFTITPNTGYKVGSLLVNGSSVTPATSYTFTSVKANGTIAASFVITKDTTFVVTTTHGIRKDTVIVADSVVQSNKDTVVTTTKNQITTDTAITTTDSLENGVKFGTKKDTVITKSTITLSSTVKTLLYKPTVTTATKTVHTIVKDTVSSVSSSLTAGKDTVVTTIRNEITTDSTKQQTDTLYDAVVVKTVFALLNVSQTVIAIDTVKDTLKYQPAITTRDSTYHLLGIDTITTVSKVVETDKDTVVTTMKKEITIDTTVIRTDTLSDGVVKSFSLKILPAVTDTVVLYTTVDTLKYQPVITTAIDTVHFVGKDTTTAVKRELLTGADSLITTTITVTTTDTTVARTNTLADGVVMTSLFDTLSIVPTTVVTVIKDTLYAYSAKRDTVHYTGTDSTISIPDTTILGNGDSLVTTIITVYTYDTTVVITDSLKSGVSFKKTADTLSVAIDSVVTTIEDTLYAQTAILKQKNRDRVEVVLSANPVPAERNELVFMLPASTVSSTIVVLDVTGNVVFRAESQSSQVVWDLTNRHGVRVAGNFRAVARIAFSGGEVKVWDSMIGVQK